MLSGISTRPDMTRSRISLPTIIALAASPALLVADDAFVTGSAVAVQTAVDRGLMVVQKAARSYPSHRECFSCHHQTLPAFAMVTARDAGFEIDETLLGEQVEFTRQSFAGKIEQVARGENVGGRSATVSYALWMFDVCRTERNEVTDALVSYLLTRQEDDGHWTPASNRPPLEQSSVSCTLLSAYGLQNFVGESQRDVADTAIDKAQTWLKSAPLVCHEDRVARLWGLQLFDQDAAVLESARAELLSRQHADGGWAQTDDMESDAYATGQAVYVLRLAGVAADDAGLQKAVDYLVRTQQPDGSWHVVTRSKPIQTFFDNGDPHGKDQFISVSATSWAVAALAGCVRRE
jgi:N-acyl-D-amino-acid deacylase